MTWKEVAELPWATIAELAILALFYGICFVFLGPKKAKPQ